MKVIAKGVVWENPKPYLCSRQAMHPTLVSLGGDEYFCAFDIGQAPESLDYRTYKARSVDDGGSWDFEGRLVPGETERPSTHSIRVSRFGEELIGFGHRAWRDNPNEGVLSRENLGYVPMDLVLVRSGDGGRTFSTMEVIEPPLVGPGFEVCHSVVELAGGRWLAPTSTWRGWDGDLPNGEKGLVLISDDQGIGWPTFGVTFDGSAEAVIHWEQSAVALADDRVLVVSWVYHPESGAHLPNRYTISRDQGESFASARELGLVGQTCKACALEDGRLLFVYRRVDCPGLWAQLAELKGDSVALAEELPLWGTSLIGSGMTGTGNRSDELSGLHFGFPQMVQKDDGSILLVFWGHEDEVSKIHWMRIELDLNR